LEKEYLFDGKLGGWLSGTFFMLAMNLRVSWQRTIQPNRK
jgi:hypothetical protein